MKMVCIRGTQDIKMLSWRKAKSTVEHLFIAAKNLKLPTEPGEMAEDLKRCYTAAKIVRIDASSSRAMAVIREGSWPVAVDNALACWPG
jgi:hypothetical protein